MYYNELRITNKVYNIASGSKEVCEVEAITRLGIQYNSETRQGTCLMQNIELIPLTSSILEAFKGESFFTSDPQERPASKKFVFDNLTIHMCNEDVQEFIFEANEFVDVKTVNQFQNLYYDLHGKNLQYNYVF